MTSYAQAESLEALKKSDDLTGYPHRQLIGWVGLALPIALLVIHEWRPTNGLEGWTLLNSVSAYYHTGGVAAFVGSLVALAAFFVTYEGYKNDSRRADRWTAIIASAAAIGVAFFPTAAPAGLPSPSPSWWTPLTGIIHYASAVVLFGCFIFFSLFLFTRSNKQKGLWQRNSLYVLCGWVMVGCVIWAAVAEFYNKSIFWAEAVALAAFAASWLAKGRAEWTLLHYGRHPGRIVGDLQEVMRLK